MRITTQLTNLNVAAFSMNVEITSLKLKFPENCNIVQIQRDVVHRILSEILYSVIRVRIWTIDLFVHHLKGKTRFDTPNPRVQVLQFDKCSCKCFSFCPKTALDLVQHGIVSSKTASNIDEISVNNSDAIHLILQKISKAGDSPTHVRKRHVSVTSNCSTSFSFYIRSQKGQPALFWALGSPVCREILWSCPRSRNPLFVNTFFIIVIAGKGNIRYANVNGSSLKANLYFGAFASQRIKIA